MRKMSGNCLDEAMNRLIDVLRPRLLRCLSENLFFVADVRESNSSRNLHRQILGAILHKDTSPSRALTDGTILDSSAIPRSLSRIFPGRRNWQRETDRRTDGRARQRGSLIMRFNARGIYLHERGTNANTRAGSRQDSRDLALLVSRCREIPSRFLSFLLRRKRMIARKGKIRELSDQEIHVDQRSFAKDLLSKPERTFNHFLCIILVYYLQL